MPTNINFLGAKVRSNNKFARYVKPATVQRAKRGSKPWYNLLFISRLLKKLESQVFRLYGDSKALIVRGYKIFNYAGSTFWLGQLQRSYWGLSSTKRLGEELISQQVSVEAFKDDFYIKMTLNFQISSTVLKVLVMTYDLRQLWKIYDLRLMQTKICGPQSPDSNHASG